MWHVASEEGGEGTPARHVAWLEKQACVLLNRRLICMACGSGFSFSFSSDCDCECDLRLRPVSVLATRPRTLPPSVALFKYRIKSVSDNCKAHCRPAWPMPRLPPPFTFSSLSPFLLSCDNRNQCRLRQVVQAAPQQEYKCAQQASTASSNELWHSAGACGATCGGANIDGPVSHMTFNCAAAPSSHSPSVCTQSSSGVSCYYVYAMCAPAFKRSACEMQIPLAAQRVVCAMQVCMNDEWSRR